MGPHMSRLYEKHSKITSHCLFLSFIRILASTHLPYHRPQTQCGIIILQENLHLKVGLETVRKSSLMKLYMK